MENPPFQEIVPSKKKMNISIALLDYLRVQRGTAKASKNAREICWYENQPWFGAIGMSFHDDLQKHPPGPYIQLASIESRKIWAFWDFFAKTHGLVFHMHPYDIYFYFGWPVGPWVCQLAHGFAVSSFCLKQGSWNFSTHFWGESNNTKFMVILRDFPCSNALFGLII